ncbi:MAG: hypothetical protein NC320_03230 [Clostridium sp.]|nr:hypothetical protein [Clostridium sp.]
MNIDDISKPEIYEESADFRFFCKWFESSLKKIQCDTENIFDLYDPLRCPEELLWLLADTMGYKYDDREQLPTSFNRLVLLYFMSMIYNRGSKDGVTLAAEVNLAQFVINDRINGYTDENGNKVEGNKIFSNRLEDTSIPVNSVYVTPHTPYGYIDVVYFSKELPKDACIEYVRPLGMFLFQHAGVRFDARTKISIDARLTDDRDISWRGDFAPTHIGHYRREDYTRLQKAVELEHEIEGIEYKKSVNDIEHTKHSVWHRNSDFEDTEYGDGSYESGTGTTASPYLNLGYRALYSLQISNNDEIIRSLVGPIFSLGFEPQNVTVTYPDDYINIIQTEKDWNLRYDRRLDESHTMKNSAGEYDVSIVDDKRSKDILTPRPTVNPIMSAMGNAISLNNENTRYTKTDSSGNISSVDIDE